MINSSKNVNLLVRDGIHSYNQKDFFVAHEFFEDAWRETIDETREFYRALLQISAGHFRLQQNRPRSANKFFKKALFWLEPFSEDHLGFNLSDLRKYLRLLINVIDAGMQPTTILYEHFETLQSTLYENFSDQTKILISGFEPFGIHPENPSMDLVKALPDQLSNQIRLYKTILPVDDVYGPNQLIEKIYQTKPNAVMAFGFAPKREEINLERVAINLKDYRISDNVGNKINDQPIIPNGPAAYFSNLPIRKMLSALTSANIPGTISLSAGSFLCNQVFYSMMHEISINKWPIYAGFIHLPGYQLDSLNTKGIHFNLDMMINAAKVLCNVLIDEPKLK